MGIALMVLAWAAVFMGFNVSGHAFIRYWLFVTAHGLNLGGFVLAALGDARSKRAFSTFRLAFAIVAEFAFAIAGPVAMGAADATLR